MANEIALRPSYWASVSGGKDSLYMLKLILENLDRYPLDGVVHFELEIDYPFIKNVVDYMESECKKHGIKFVRIPPKTSWMALYNKYGYPTRKVRWCNEKYKLTAKKSLEEFLNKQGEYLICYIGYCVDEEKRYYSRGEKKKEVYPLVDFGIEENTIWKWAKTQPIFNNYYKTNKRCCCIGCPMSSKHNWAYLYKYYRGYFDTFWAMMHATEIVREAERGRPFSVTSSNPKYNADYLINTIETKWLKILEKKEKE